MRIKSEFLQQAQKSVPLGPFTTFGLGGKTAYLLETAEPAKLVLAVQAAKKEKMPYRIIAGGSNIVAGDKRYPGLVVVYRERGKDTSPESLRREGDRLAIFGSVPLWKAVDFAAKNGLAGLENLAGIPGTVGGAVYGNAGAYGHSISEAVEKVLVFDGRAERWLAKDECRFAYRESVFKKKSWLLLSVVLKLAPADTANLKARVETLLSERGKKYSDIKCPGSFFKNVLAARVSKAALKKIDQSKIIDGKIPAGYLLEEVGAKGMKQGGLFVADYHGNLIINSGTGTYKDVEKLVKALKEKVKARFGIALEEEVRYFL